MRKLLPLAALLLAGLLLAGCGHEAVTEYTKTTAIKAEGVEYIPRSAIALVPESARTPAGAKGADRSHFVEGTPPLTLIGGEIQLDNFGAELTGAFENVYQRVYCPFWDAYGRVWTRALGETDWSGNFGGRCITRAEAVRNLRYLMDTQYLPVVRDLGVNFSHEQVDALGDLSYNVGPGTICCTLASLLRAHAWGAAAVYIRRYSFAGGVFLQGLFDRRVREGQLLQHTEPVHHETPAQRRAREERELAGHEHELALLRLQLVRLRLKLRADGCYAREKAHQKLGPKCEGWTQAGNRVSAHGRLEDADIAKLRRELA